MFLNMVILNRLSQIDPQHDPQQHDPPYDPQQDDPQHIVTC